MYQVHNLIDLLCQDANLDNRSDKVLLQDANNSLSPNALLERCNTVAEALLAAQCKFVALYADNSCDWVTIDLACQQASICLIPIPTFFSKSQIAHVFDSVTIDMMVSDSTEPFSAVPSLQVDSITAIFGGQLQLIKLRNNRTRLALPPGTQKITFTSGSTGQPKGVCLSVEQQLIQAKALATAVDLQQPRHLCLLPLSTLLENIAGTYAPLMAGGKVIIPSLAEVGFKGSSSLDPKRFCAAISRYQPNSIILTPQLLVVLIAAATQGWVPPDSLQFVAVGGGRVSAQLMAKAHQHNIPAYEGYGLSECVSVVSLNTPTNTGANSSGKPLPHLQVKTVNGEIIISGNTMLGYAGQPDSWGHTTTYSGDLGSLDSAGYLSVSGRKKNLLISSFGRNINPEWIESELLANTAIADAVVFGDDRPYCVALLFPRDPALTDHEIQGLIDSVNNTLPDYARIVRWQRFATTLNSQPGLLTDNGRPVRVAILTAYQAILETLYPNDTQVFQ